MKKNKKVYKIGQIIRTACYRDAKNIEYDYLSEITYVSDNFVYYKVLKILKGNICPNEGEEDLFFLGSILDKETIIISPKFTKAVKVLYGK